MKKNIIYLILFLILILFTLMLVGVLIYRADRTDKYFEAVRMEENQKIFN